MNFLHNDNTKKISASFFMALLVFVLAVKTFHTHDFFYTKNDNSSKPVTIAVNYFCSICEYQLTKDINTGTIVIDLSPPLIFLHTYYHFKINLAVVSEKDFSVRGPPALV